MFKNIYKKQDAHEFLCQVLYQLKDDVDRYNTKLKERTSANKEVIKSSSSSSFSSFTELNEENKKIVSTTSTIKTTAETLSISLFIILISFIETHASK